MGSLPPSAPTARQLLLLEPLRLGASLVAHRLFLAPMAGYTDAPFRQVCTECGASLCFAEMVSAEAILRGSDRTLRLLDRFPGERLLGCQIFAASPVAAAAATRAVAALSPAVIDLNCGCSVAKVLKGGCGAALLRDPGLIGAIVRAMRGETDLPISLKLRSGWDPDSPTFLDCATEAVRAGAAMVTLHPRWRTQGFGGRSRWEELAVLKTAVPVPVFGSGDLLRAHDCLLMADRTGIDGVMVARGTLGNPFIFDETLALLRGSRLAVGPRERLEAALHHLELAAGRRGEEVACREMRKHFVAYSKGLEGGAAFRQLIVHAETVDRYQNLVAEFLSQLEAGGPSGGLPSRGPGASDGAADGG